MGEPRDGPGLALKAGQVLGRGALKELEGDEAAELRVLRLPNLAHSPFPE
jgi:hypothetical protein